MGATFNTLFMVRASFRVISGCDVILNMSTGAAIKLQTAKCFFYLPVVLFRRL